MRTWQIRENEFDLSITHNIDASKEAVYDVLAELEAYPDFINDLVSVKRDGDVYHFVARAAILTIPATVAVIKTPGQTVAFELVEGPVDRLKGAWLVEAGDTPDQTKVTLTVHAETDERGEWLLRMTGRYVQNKTDKLITAFSYRVVELQRGDVTATSVPRTAPGGGLIGWFKRLWARIFGAQAVASAKPASTLFRDEHNVETLEALASTMMPADEFDAGVQDLGFISLAEMRSRYEAGRETLYATALDAVDKMAQAMFDKPYFVDLTPADRAALLDAVRQGRVNGEVWGHVEPSTFFGALWEDVIFLYCTHPDTWRRIGFPGPSFDTGGYPDYSKPQDLMRKWQAGQ
jgi:ribosome-associated toxin RatA of RatAB toxin-antitoxin module